MGNEHRILRRAKTCIVRDVLHTMRLGLVIFVVL